MAQLTYRSQIEKHFRSGRTISSLEALGLYGCADLSTAVRDLKAKGLKIVTEIKKDIRGKRYARYSLKRPKLFRGVR